MSVSCDMLKQDLMQVVFIFADEFSKNVILQVVFHFHQKTYLANATELHRWQDYSETMMIYQALDIACSDSTWLHVDFCYGWLESI